MSAKQTLRSRITLNLNPVAAAVAAAIGSMGFMSLAHAAQDEMIVTATRRDAAIQEIPMNISAISGEEIANLRLNNAAELARIVPGLTSVDQGGRAGALQIIRGLNVDSLAASESYGNGNGGTVATYYGEIPLYIDLKLIDLERVEVLRGPQGTLYGANSLGGTIRYIPKKPDPTQFTAEAHGQISSQSESGDASYDADLVLNAPLIEDKLAIRAVLGYEDRAGFIDYNYLVREPGFSNPQPDFNDPDDVNANLRRKKDANTIETTSARISALWNITDDIEATVYYHLQDQEIGGRQANTFDSMAADPLNLQTGDYVAAFRVEEPSDRKNEIFGADLKWDLNFAELTTAIGHTKYEQDGQRDQTDFLLLFGAPYNEFPEFTAFTSDTNDTEIDTAEIRLVSQNDGPLNWIGGLFYYDADETVTSVELTPGIGNFLGITLTDDVEYFQKSDQSFKEKAIFGELDYDLTDKWNVLFGARYFETEQQFTQVTGLPLLYIQFGVLPDGLPVADYALEPVIGPKRDVDDTVFKFNTSYQFNDDALGYLTLSEGYRPGGTNAIDDCSTGNPVCGTESELTYDADKTLNYELGAKTAWLDGSVIVNAAVYYIDWTDIQSSGLSAGGGLPITINGQDAESKGLEVDFVANFSDHWAVRGQYSYVDAELSEAAPGIDPDSQSGDRLPGSPEHGGSVFLDYFDNVGALNLFATYGMTVQSDVLTTLGDGSNGCCRNDGEKLSGFALHTASVSLSNNVWSATLYIDNLYDKLAVTGTRPDRSLLGSAGGSQDFQIRRYMQYVAAPRTIGLDFRYKWGS